MEEEEEKISETNLVAASPQQLRAPRARRMSERGLLPLRVLQHHHNLYHNLQHLPVSSSFLAFHYVLFILPLILHIIILVSTPSFSLAHHLLVFSNALVVIAVQQLMTLLGLSDLGLIIKRQPV